MWTRIKNIRKSDDFSYFIRYFAAFSLIFFLMTALILQVFQAGIYESSDKNFNEISKEPQLLLMFAQDRGFQFEPPSEETGQTENSSSTKDSSSDTAETKVRFSEHSDRINLSTYYSVILYDSKGNIINQVDPFSGISTIALNKNVTEQIQTTNVTTSYGASESYRLMTFKLSDYHIKGSNSQDVSYATVLYNTTQMETTIASNNRIVIIVMSSFWLISILVSYYLAKLSLKPLKASYQKQKEFVENASHELRTPLSVLQNRLETLFRKPNATVLESSESIGSSLEEVRNMRLLTTNLLNLARRDEGLQVKLESISPSYFSEVLENFQLIAEENEKELVVENTVKVPVHSDKTLLKQLLTILFDNAMKYTDQDGKIRIAVQVKERYLVLLVSDNGLGIKDSDKKKIFDRFFRVDKARTRQKGGFGLGLSLAKQIIDSLKGTIIVRDNQPCGTIFEVRIPR
ncbi:sensor histidine kinase [Streptococcus sp. DD13]|uniref:sensor histidine kinase n=1 Tax=Streptococcus sp. DD13 TaxID=1777881 RepID=UPI0007922013|nr:HAMP domain-containing sensor histidine kinase [Streptococcus sp. DD13]KXT78637.1 Two component system sensor histidine kinase CiaH [Streptococcus sp. DD13]